MAARFEDHQAALQGYVPQNRRAHPETDTRGGRAQQDGAGALFAGKELIGAPGLNISSGIENVWRVCDSAQQIFHERGGFYEAGSVHQYRVSHEEGPG